MREVSYQFMPKAAYSELAALENVFVSPEQDTVPAAFVDESIQRAVEAIGDAPTQPVIFEFGRAHSLWYESRPADYNWNVYSDHMPIPEEVAHIETAVGALRKKVLGSLEASFPESEFIMVTNFMHRERIGLSEAGDVVKRPIDWDANWESEGATAKRQRMAALRHMYTVTPRSEHVAYNIISIDPTEERHDGMQVQRKLPIQTLDERLASPEPPTLQQAVRYVKEATDGLAYLAEHGLRLMDLTLENIAVDTTTDKALWFDFDGLRSDSDTVAGYVARREYWPPERRPKPIENECSDSYLSMFANGDFYPADKPKGTIDIAESIFEIGVSLGRLLDAYDEPPQPLRALVTAMTAHESASRPALDEVQNILAQYSAAQKTDSIQ